MSKRYYYPNRKITDSRLPFEIQITSGLTAYYIKNGSQIKADSLFLKTLNWLDISIDDYNIIIKGIKKNGDLIYTILKRGKEL